MEKYRVCFIQRARWVVEILFLLTLFFGGLPKPYLEAETRSDSSCIDKPPILFYQSPDYTLFVSKTGEIKIRSDAGISIEARLLFEGTIQGLKNFCWEKISDTKPEGLIVRFEYGKEGVNYRSGIVTTRILPSSGNIQFNVSYQLGPFLKNLPEIKGTKAIGSFPNQAFDSEDRPPVWWEFILSKDVVTGKEFFVGKSAGLVVTKKLEEISPNEEIPELTELKIIGLRGKTVSWNLENAAYSLFGARYGGKKIESWSLVVMDQIHSSGIAPDEIRRFSFGMYVH